MFTLVAKGCDPKGKKEKKKEFSLSQPWLQSHDEENFTSQDKKILVSRHDIKWTVIILFVL